jgi:hypothetical protein
MVMLAELLPLPEHTPLVLIATASPELALAATVKLAL